MSGAIGYFVHHQGRGHAERAAAIVNALNRPVMLFSARDDIFPPMGSHVAITRIPSLFEAPTDAPAALSRVATPATMHCAPLGWHSITRAVATITEWFLQTRPALFVTDVSAELAQLARIASIPCVPVLQHGDRDDPAHMAAYEGALGILAPYHPMLEQPGRPEWMRAKMHHAPGLGVGIMAIDRMEARTRLDLPHDRDIVLVVSGGGGEGTPVTPLTLGARAEPDTLWITIGTVASEWHATSPGNLRHMGWVDNPTDYIAAADRVVSSAGNTTVHMVAAAAKPWIIVPEWRYFDEQRWKARMLDQVGAAAMLDHWPSHVDAWHDAWARARMINPARQRMLIDQRAAAGVTEWFERLAAWQRPADAAEGPMLLAQEKL